MYLLHALQLCSLKQYVNRRGRCHYGNLAGRLRMEKRNENVTTFLFQALLHCIWKRHIYFCHGIWIHFSVYALGAKIHACNLLRRSPQCVLTPTGSATQINTPSAADFSQTIPPNRMGKSSFSSFKYWQQLYFLWLLWKIPFSYLKRGNCKVVRFSVARPSCFPHYWERQKVQESPKFKKVGFTFCIISQQRDKTSI